MLPKNRFYEGRIIPTVLDYRNHIKEATMAQHSTGICFAYGHAYDTMA
jgi:hypothetical protein